MRAVDLGIESIEPGRLIGAGGTAAVYAARRSDGSLVAVKLLRTSIASEDARHLFDKERQAIDRIAGHPNIVEILDAGLTDRGEPYLVMPLMNGSLQDFIENDGPMPWAKAASIMAKVSDAIAHAHAHEVLHRDIKPANILIDPVGEPRVADFGIAKMVDAATLNTMNHALTPGYAPPERLRGESATVSGDVYGLAATLYALIAGVSPFVGADEISTEAALHQVLNDEPPMLETRQAPETIAQLVRRGLAKSSASRPLGAAAFGAALRTALAVDGDEIGDAGDAPPGWVRAPMAKQGFKVDHGAMIEPTATIAAPIPARATVAPSPSRQFVDRALSPRSWWLVIGGAGLFAALFLSWADGSDGESGNAFQIKLPWALTGETLDPGMTFERLAFGLDVGEAGTFAHGWIFAAIAIATLFLAFSARSTRLVRVLTATIGVSSAGLVVANYLSFSEQFRNLKSMFDRTVLVSGVSLTPGPGFYLAGLASIAIVIGSATSIRNSETDIRTAEAV